MEKIGEKPSGTIARNLKRIERIAWLEGTPSRLDELDDDAQHSVMQMVISSGMKRLEAFKTVEHLMLHGKDRGRRAASLALGQFTGADANTLALQALEDPDPQVQVNTLVQLRQRGIPGAMSRLIEMVDSPHAMVSEAARSQLDEFSFERYLAAFDVLEEDVRLSTGMLVKKVDLQALPALVEEMSALARSRRLRAISAAHSMQVVDQLEGPFLELLSDEDHMVRSEVARVLADCSSLTVRDALQEALADRSVSVQLAAKESLAKLSREGPVQNIQQVGKTED